MSSPPLRFLWWNFYQISEVYFTWLTIPGGCRSTRTLTKSYHANSYPSQLTILSYSCYVMYNTNKNTTQYSSSVKAYYQWRLSLFPDGASEPWSIWGERKKHYRIRTQLKHILNVITLCTTVNISSFTRLPINFRLLFSIIVWTLGIPSTYLNSHRFSLPLSAKILTADS